MKHVLFDLDGTLTDPKPGITRSIAHAIRCMNLPEVDPDELGWCIGPPLRGSLAKLIGAGDPEMALAHFRERFGDVGWSENAVYPGIPEALSHLRVEGFRLHVATSKPEHFAKRILDHFDLRHHFDLVVGSELDGRREAKAEVIAHLLAEGSIDASKAVMIGDRMHDVEGARHHGIKCIGVLYGYGHPGELEEAGAWPLCSTPHEIADAVLQLRRAASRNA